MRNDRNCKKDREGKEREKESKKKGGRVEKRNNRRGGDFRGRRRIEKYVRKLINEKIWRNKKRRVREINGSNKKMGKGVFVDKCLRE